MANVMRFQNPNLLVYIAMADAYAVSCEDCERRVEGKPLLDALAFTRYAKRPNKRTGCYTDDAEMSIANTHVLLARAPDTAVNFADAYVREFRRGGKRAGYSKQLYRILSTVRSGKELLAQLIPNSTRNGAAMRSVPIGVFADVNDVLDVATIQAKVTHDTPEGRFSARAVALMAHFTMYENLPLHRMAAYCLERLPEPDVRQFGHVFKRPWPYGVPVIYSTTKSMAEGTVHAALTAIMTQPTLLDIMRWILETGGDTDTIAAIAWGVASTRHQDERLPEFFERDLEGGVEKNINTSAPYLRELGEVLMMMYGPTTMW